MILLFITLSSCRTAKKDWVNENFTSKTETQAIKEAVSLSSETLKSAISETVNAKYNEILQNQSSISTETESENTTIEVDITAEAGKEKSATIGNTTVTSNGANVKVVTSTSKESSKEFQEKFEQQTQQLTESLTRIETLEKRDSIREATQVKMLQEIEQLKKTQSKRVNNIGLTFGTVIWIVAILIVLYFLWRIKKKLSWVT